MHDSPVINNSSYPNPCFVGCHDIVTTLIFRAFSPFCPHLELAIRSGCMHEDTTQMCSKLIADCNNLSSLPVFCATCGNSHSSHALRKLPFELRVLMDSCSGKFSLKCDYPNDRLLFFTLSFEISSPSCTEWTQLRTATLSARKEFAICSLCIPDC